MPNIIFIMCDSMDGRVMGCMGHPAMRRGAVDWYEKALVLAAKLKAEAVGGHIGAFSVRDFRNERKRRLLTSNLIETLNYLSSIGKRLGLKYLPMGANAYLKRTPTTIEAAKNLLSKVNEESSIPVKLCIDVGHICNPEVKSSRDLDPYAWLKELGRDALCLHLQQTDGKADRHRPFTEE